jgi:hypothetical protein
MKLLKRPVVVSLLISSAIIAGVLVYALATARNVDEKPFIIYFSLIAFPFVWLLIWAFAYAIAFFSREE